VRGALVAGTVLSLIVVGAWSVLAAATLGPVPPLHLDWHHPVAAYLALAAAPTGTAPGLFAVVAAIYTLCLLVAGRRRARRGARDA
jgi:hypothetical protein